MNEPLSGAVCDDGEPCTTGTCNAEDGCVFAAHEGPCDDGDLCTIGEPARARLEPAPHREWRSGGPGSRAGVVRHARSGQGGRSGSEHLPEPLGWASDGERLYVSDVSGNRLLVFDTLPTTSFAPADFVIAQPDFQSAIANVDHDPVAAIEPSDVEVAEGRLYVADPTNNRVLIWDEPPTENATPADGVIGHDTMTGWAANDGGVSESSFNTPGGLATDGKRLFVADTLNRRVVIRALPEKRSVPGPRSDEGRGIISDGLA